MADTQLLLWNSSTRESAPLPHADFNELHSSFGLGYDATSDGYKILKLNITNYPKQWIEILTLKSGSWRKISCLPTVICPTTGCKLEIYPYPNKIVDPMVYVHAAFHWLGYLFRRKYYVVSFDISNEVFGVVPLLEDMFVGVDQGLPDSGLSLLDGMLCFHITAKDDSMGMFKLWAMKDYGVKESWIVLFTIQVDYLAIAKPKYRFPDGDVLLYSRGDPTSRFKTSDLHISDIQRKIWILASLTLWLQR
ncbi:hypothetical protein FXO37_04244 [Capsicum annuum]|nr:hypothetical protein FXO37_04244 [Capsicum annuum]